MDEPTLVTLFLCGDVMTGRGVDQILAHPSPPRLYESVITSALDYVALAEHATGPIPRPAAPAYPWGVLPDVLAHERPDVRIVNLETSITTSEAAAPKGINYRMHPANVAVLTAAGIDCCVLANNHVLDWGRAGLLETTETLAAAGIRVAGAGRDLAAARAPAALEVAGGHRVLVFAFGATDSGIGPSSAAGATTPGVHLILDYSAATVQRVARMVARERRPGDIVVASAHWGGNWGYEIARDRRRFARALVDDAGVDVVHGHSSHHPMAIEIHHERAILHGCGDFLNDYEGIRGHEDYRGDLVLAYLVTVNARTGAVERLRLAPLQIRHFSLHHPAPADREWLRARLDRECARFGHRVTSLGDSFALEWG